MSTIAAFFSSFISTVHADADAEQKPEAEVEEAPEQPVAEQKEEEEEPEPLCCCENPDDQCLLPTSQTHGGCVIIKYLPVRTGSDPFTKFQNFPN